VPQETDACPVKDLTWQQNVKPQEAKREQVSLSKVFEAELVGCLADLWRVPGRIQRGEAILTADDAGTKVDQLAVDLVAALIDDKIARFDVAVRDTCESEPGTSEHRSGGSALSADLPTARM